MREIRDDETGLVFLERYFLFQRCGWTAYLHRFRASDPGRGWHDHPWRRAYSLILSGGYGEERVAGLDAAGLHIQWRTVRPLSLNRLRGSTFHRVLLADGHDAWSLFCHGPWVKQWGFLNPVGAPCAGGVTVEILPTHEEVGTDFWWRTAPTGKQVRQARGEA